MGDRECNQKTLKNGSKIFEESLLKGLSLGLKWRGCLRT